MEKGYKDLIVWQKAKQLAVEAYRLTGKFPASEIYGITAQIRRAAVSIPSNIAEGYRRNHKKEQAQFLRIAFGSGAELETQMEISKEIFSKNGIDFAPAEILLEEVMKMLNKLISIV